MNIIRNSGIYEYFERQSTDSDELYISLEAIGKIYSDIPSDYGFYTLYKSTLQDVDKYYYIANGGIQDVDVRHLWYGLKHPWDDTKVNIYIEEDYATAAFESDVYDEISYIIFGQAKRYDNYKKKMMTDDELICAATNRLISRILDVFHKYSLENMESAFG